MISSGGMYAQKNSASSSSQTNGQSSNQKSSFHMISSSSSSSASNKMANAETNCIKNSPNNNGNVKFSTHVKEKIDEREKYLTAKYPNHQMLLIKKRLKVEFWIDEQLKHLFEIKVEINVKIKFIYLI